VSAALSYAAWAVLGVAALALWFRAQSSPAVARPAAVLARLSTGPVARVMLVVAWMWAGWHLFAR
jgi:hypothetical protein